MNRNILCLLALLLLLGCKKNDPKPEVHCYPQTYVHSAERSFKIPYRFIYNEKMQLIGLEEPLSNYLANRFFYNEDGTLKYSEELDDEKRVFRTTVYSYDAKGRLSRAELFSRTPSEKGPSNYFLFTYDADNRLIKIEFYGKESSSGEYRWFGSNTYTFFSNQEMKASYKHHAVGARLIEWETLNTFDDKKSPYWSIPGYRTMLMVHNPSLSFKNNIIRFKLLTEESNKQQDYISTFEYSPDGFPITEYRSIGGNEYWPGYMYRHDYTYTCK